MNENNCEADPVGSVVGGAVTWPGELDLAPDAMHEEIKQRGGEWVVEK